MGSERDGHDEDEAGDQQDGQCSKQTFYRSYSQRDQRRRVLAVLQELVVP
jgi:hypothetical protein